MFTWVHTALYGLFTLPVFELISSMGESFQDYSWIQDFEDDFPQKVILKCWIKEIILASLICFQSI